MFFLVFEAMVFTVVTPKKMATITAKAVMIAIIRICFMASRAFQDGGYLIEDAEAGIPI